ncbi:MAG: hypothetical protein ACREBI_10665 [Nitrosotalea sp.]
MRKPRPAVDVRKTIEFDKFLNSIPEGKTKNEVIEAFSLLKEDCTRGDNIPKSLISYYIQHYGVNNAWRYELSGGARMIYAIVLESNGLAVYLLEGFVTHDEYEKRFGY